MNPGASLAKQGILQGDRTINATLELLEKHPEGLRWTDLRKMIEASDPSLHPKAVVAKNFLVGGWRLDI